VDRESLFESVPNFSEGRRPDVIGAIAAAAGTAHLLDTDADPDHNRVVVTVTAFRAKLINALMAAIGQAVDRIDLRQHQGVHPRVGAADVVPIVPLGETALASCHEVAQELGHRIWAELKVPVFFYGHSEKNTLADIRAGRLKPDLGGPELHPTAGAVCVGVRGLLVAFNVILYDTDLVGARALARSLRESGAGLRGVQALAFPLSGGRVQLSMNLFRLQETNPAHVIAELRRLGVSMGGEQVVGLCPAIAAHAAAAGRLLEGRLAAAAARSAAARSSEQGDDEHVALASKLGRESAGLAELGIEQDALLGGAERAAALIEVIRAGRVLDGELEAILRAAALGLRAAITSETRTLYQARTSALDARLGSG
jgi:glutamate formiminotransferase / 5-formyltetrahydrofolate cyclo-ligase